MNSGWCWDWVDKMLFAGLLLVGVLTATMALPATVERTADCVERAADWYAMWTEPKSEVCHCCQCDATAQKEATMEQAA